MNSKLRHLYRELRRQEAQTMAEYGVTLAVICIATVSIFGLLSVGITDAIQGVIDLLPGAGS